MNKVKLPNRPIGPFPAVLVGAEVNGRPNYAAVGACGVVSLEPVLYVSLKDSHHTTAGVKETGYFSVNVPSAGMVAKFDYCGLVSGRDADKGALFTAFYDEQGRAPLIAECPLNFLCKVVSAIPLYGFQLFLGDIVAVYGREEAMTDSRLDPRKAQPIIMMGSEYFALGQALGTVFTAGRAVGPSKNSAEGGESNA